MESCLKPLWCWQRKLVDVSAAPRFGPCGVASLVGFSVSEEPRLLPSPVAGVWCSAAPPGYGQPTIEYTRGPQWFGSTSGAARAGSSGRAAWFGRHQLQRGWPCCLSCQPKDTDAIRSRQSCSRWQRHRWHRWRRRCGTAGGCGHAGRHCRLCGRGGERQRCWYVDQQ